MKEAIDHSLNMLHQLSSTSSKLGSSSYSFLHKLVQATSELSDHGAAKRRRKNDIALEPSTVELFRESTPVPASANVSMDASTTIVDHRTMTTAPDQLSFDLDNFLANNPFGDMFNSATFDMGGMEQIWDWENLHLNVFT
jgi:hypothetical protein